MIMSLALNINQLKQDLIYKKFTDIKLVLTDSKRTISIEVHKFVLRYSSDYFYKSLNFDGAKNEYKMNVDDANIARDIIMSFYDASENQSCLEWEYILKSIKFKNYLCLSIDARNLYGLKVPPEGFKLLLEVIDLFDVKKDIFLIKTVLNNLPPNYDVTFFSEKLIKVLLEELFNKMAKRTYYLAFVKKRKSIGIMDLDTRVVINTSSKHDGTITDLILTSDNTKLISSSDNGEIKIWNPMSGILINDINNCKFGVYGLILSNNNKLLIASHYDYNIRIWDMDTYEMIGMLRDHRNNIYGLAISNDNKHIISGSYDETIKIWDVDTQTCIHTINNAGKINFIILSSDGQQIISGDRMGQVTIFDANTYQKIITLTGSITNILNMAISKDTTKLACCGYDCIELWNLNTTSIINKIMCENANRIFFHDNDSKIIFSSDYGDINCWDFDRDTIINIHREKNEIFAIFEKLQ